MSYSRRMVGLNLGAIRRLSQRRAVGSTVGGELLLFLPGDCEAADHFPELLPGRDMGDAHFTELLKVEQGQPFREQFAIDNAFPKPRNHAIADAAGKLVERGPDPLQVVRFDMLETVPEDDPVNAFAGGLRALRPAVPDKLGIEARLGDLIIFRMDLADQVEVDKTVVHR